MDIVIGVLPFCLSFVFGGLSGGITHIFEYYYGFYETLKYKQQRNELIGSHTFEESVQRELNDKLVDEYNLHNYATTNNNNNNNNNSKKGSSHHFLAEATIGDDLTIKMFKNANDSFLITGGECGLNGIFGFDFALCLHKILKRVNKVVKKNNSLRINKKKYGLFSMKDKIYIGFNGIIALYLLNKQKDNLLSYQIFRQEQLKAREMVITSNVVSIGMHGGLREFGSFMSGIFTYVAYYYLWLNKDEKNMSKLENIIETIVKLIKQKNNTTTGRNENENNNDNMDRTETKAAIEIKSNMNNVNNVNNVNNDNVSKKNVEYVVDIDNDNDVTNDDVDSKMEILEESMSHSVTPCQDDNGNHNDNDNVKENENENENDNCHDDAVSVENTNGKHDMNETIIKEERKEDSSKVVNGNMGQEINKQQVTNLSPKEDVETKTIDV